MPTFLSNHNLSWSVSGPDTASGFVPETRKHPSPLPASHTDNVDAKRRRGLVSNQTPWQRIAGDFLHAHATNIHPGRSKPRSHSDNAAEAHEWLLDAGEVELRSYLFVFHRTRDAESQNIDRYHLMKDTNRQPCLTK